jgi:hypothetical protein
MIVEHACIYLAPLIKRSRILGENGFLDKTAEDTLWNIWQQDYSGENMCKIFFITLSFQMFILQHPMIIQI